ncbi:MAG: prepilin-type N-terminal cleavage/methylation domain-containing protein [Terriglobales bacterium]|jgi:prepilin-type N-terminal cleavage/methylation domain-containing protein
MSDRRKKREGGFSLLEMVVAMALGTIVLGAAVSIYIQGVNATWTVSQRAELQQDFRAASNLLTKDLSLAGAGLGQGASIQLPTSATLPLYGCAQTTGTCYINSGAGETYPVQGTTPYLYGLLPGYQEGPTVNTMATDIVTVVYTDPTFALDCYTASVTNSTTVTFTLPGTLSCTLPTNISTPQAVNDAGVGLTAGDLVWFTFGTSNVVAEVTTAATSGGVVVFASGDKLKMNQASSAARSLASQTTGTTGTAERILVITYYLDSSVTPTRLMRQVSGHTPMPVAENVVYLNFTYDLFNTTTTTAAVGCPNPGAITPACANGSSSGLFPNQITKINIMHMDMDSSVNGSGFAQKGYSRMDLQTSVSARNLTYVNNYSN